MNMKIVPRLYSRTRSKKKMPPLVKIQDYIEIGNIPRLIKYLDKMCDSILTIPQDIIYEGGGQSSELVVSLTKKGIAFHQVAETIREIYEDFS